MRVLRADTRCRCHRWSDLAASDHGCGQRAGRLPRHADDHGERAAVAGSAFDAPIQHEGGMSLILRQSTSKAVSFGPFVDKTDGVTLEVGLVTAIDHATTW